MRHQPGWCVDCKCPFHYSKCKWTHFGSVTCWCSDVSIVWELSFDTSICRHHYVRQSLYGQKQFLDSLLQGQCSCDSRTVKMQVWGVWKRMSLWFVCWKNLGMLGTWVSAVWYVALLVSMAPCGDHAAQVVQVKHRRTSNISELLPQLQVVTGCWNQTPGSIFLGWPDRSFLPEVEAWCIRNEFKHVVGITFISGVT